MAKYNVTYWYLATGMDGVPDTHDYGVIEADSPEQARRKVAELDNPGKPDIQDWTMSCLSAREVLSNFPEEYIPWPPAKTY